MSSARMQRPVWLWQMAPPVALDSAKPFVPSVQTQGHTTVDVEFFVDVVQVDFDRTLTDAQGLSDTLITYALRHQAHNLLLAPGQDAGHVALTVPVSPHGIERLTRRAAFDPLSTGMHLAYTFHQETRCHLFEHHAMHPQTDRLQRLAFLNGCCQQDNPCGAQCLLHLAEHGPAILTGHTKVKDQHIRLIEVYRFECLLTILTAGKDLRVWFQSKELLQGVENEGMVVSQH